MNTRVARKIIDDWIDAHRPHGLLRLAEQSGISASLISNVRRGFVPGRYYSRERLSKALGVSQDTLFPPAKDEAAS